MIELVDIGVDYVTLTTRHGPAAVELLDATYSLANSVMGTGGYKSEIRAINGYRGEAVGPLFYGERDDGVMCRASGSAADALVLSLGEWADRLRCPRIDLQCTGKHEWDNRWYAQQTAQKARAASHRKAGGRPFHVELIDGATRGSTCTIGSRSSARYIRIYDKTRQQDNEVDANLWRYEVEYKKPLSDDIYNRVLGNLNDRAYIAAQVYAELMAKGVDPRWQQLRVTEAARIGRPKTTVERNLAWLSTVVRPMLERLDRGGYTEAYMCALGLQESASGDTLGKSRE